MSAGSLNPLKSGSAFVHLFHGGFVWSLGGLNPLKSGSAFVLPPGPPAALRARLNPLKSGSAFVLAPQKPTMTANVLIPSKAGQRSYLLGALGNWRLFGLNPLKSGSAFVPHRRWRLFRSDES